jgi:hypothetical protein
MTKKAWLAPYSWEFVTAQNAVLCQAKSALHKPTSDGHEPAKILWETKRLESMTLGEAVDVCRQCHRLAPFCFYNGNTFTAIIRDVISNLGLEEAQIILLRSLAGHIVAGVASEEENAAFRKFLQSEDLH